MDCGCGCVHSVRIGMGGAREFFSSYVELGVGVAPGSSLAFDGLKASLDSGPAGSIGFGFANFFGPVDLRLDYTTPIGMPASSRGQGVTSGSTMLSALYNIPIAKDRFDAYVGAGAGMVNVDVNHTDPSFPASANYSGSAMFSAGSSSAARA